MKIILNTEGIKFFSHFFPKIVSTWHEIDFHVYEDNIRLVANDDYSITKIDADLFAGFEIKDFNPAKFRIEVDHLANIFKKARSFNSVELNFKGNLEVTLIKGNIRNTTIIPCSYISEEDEYKFMDIEKLYEVDHFHFSLDKSLLNDILGIAKKYVHPTDDELYLEKTESDSILIQSKVDSWKNTTVIDLKDSEWIEGINASTYTFFSYMANALKLCLSETVKIVVAPDDIVLVSDVSDDYIIFVVLRCQRDLFDEDDWEDEEEWIDEE